MTGIKIEILYLCGGLWLFVLTFDFPVCWGDQLSFVSPNNNILTFQTLKMPPKDTIVCFLCKGRLSYKNDDAIKFEKHMKNEHMVKFGMEYLLAGCTMSEDERLAIKDVISYIFKLSSLSTNLGNFINNPALI